MEMKISFHEHRVDQLTGSIETTLQIYRHFYVGCALPVEFYNNQHPMWSYNEYTNKYTECFGKYFFDEKVLGMRPHFKDTKSDWIDLHLMLIEYYIEGRKDISGLSRS